MACQARNEVGSIKAFCQHAIQEQHHLRHLVFQCVVYDIEIVVGIEHVEIFDNLLIGDIALTEACCLVEDGESIAHTSVCLFGYQRQCLFFIGDAFFFSHHLQVVDGALHGHTLEVVDLATREDGWQYLVFLGSGKDKDDMSWWFLKSFEERIECRLREHVDLVDDKHLVFTHLWWNASLIHEGFDLLHAIVAGSIELKDVVRALLIKSLAAFALATSIAIGSRMHAVDDFSKYSCTSGLTHSSWSAEQIGVCQFAAKHSILQCCGQRLLSHHRVEGHRTVFAC